MTDRGIEMLEKAKWLLLEAREEAKTKYAEDRLEKIIAKIESLQRG